MIEFIIIGMKLKQHTNNHIVINAQQLHLQLQSTSCKPLSSRAISHVPAIVYKKQQCKFKLPNFNIGRIMYTGNSVMQANPDILQVKDSIVNNKKPSHICKSQDQQLLKYDQQFMVNCRNGLYRIQDKIQGTGKDFEEVRDKVGTNLICLKQNFKTKIITDAFNSKTNVSQNSNQKEVITIRGDFQSANLSQYLQVDQNQYLIALRNDTNTQGYTQWFQFFMQRNIQFDQVQVDKSDNNNIVNINVNDNSNVHGNRIYKFIIMNIRKPIKFVQQMKLMTKIHRPQGGQSQWIRNLKFEMFQSTIFCKNNKKCYALAFCLESKLLNDGIFVSLSNPYPFSRLSYFTKQMTQLGCEFQIVEISKTTLGNSIVCYRHFTPSQYQSPTIFILARQHASETSSTFISQFIIKQLTIFNTYDNLLKKFNWHIIPIANPDGIIQGNSRTTVRGYDMNRCWGQHVMHCSDEATAINAYIAGLGLKDTDIMIDLHSHSREFGMFSYANQRSDFIDFFNTTMSNLCEYYEPNKCKLGYDNEKRNTFRVQMQSRFKVKNILTLETSFYGYIDQNSNRIKQFYPTDYQSIAINILKALDLFSRRELTLLARLDAIENAIENVNDKQDQQQLQLYLDRNKLAKMGNNNNNSNNNESESDSDPEGDYLNQRDRDEVEHQQNEYNRKQKSLASLKPKINMWPASYRNIFTSRSNSKKRKQSQMSDVSRSRLNTSRNTNIVNLYNGVVRSQNQNMVSCSQNRLHRNLSLSTRQGFHCSFQLKQEHDSAGHQGRQKQRLQSMTVVQERKLVMSINNSSFEQRRSFKNLFACAQMRNSQNLKDESRDKISSYYPRTDEPKHTSVTNNYLRLSLSTDSEPKRKLNKKVKTIIFPKQQMDQEQNVLRLKTLQQIFQKKAPVRQIKKPHMGGQKLKSQRSENSRHEKTSNQKIAQLCQYVKRIEKGAIFS